MCRHNVHRSIFSIGTYFVINFLRFLLMYGDIFFLCADNGLHFFEYKKVRPIITKKKSTIYTYILYTPTHPMARKVIPNLTLDSIKQGYIMKVQTCAQHNSGCETAGVFCNKI